MELPKNKNSSVHSLGMVHVLCTKLCCEGPLALFQVESQYFDSGEFRALERRVKEEEEMM